MPYAVVAIIILVGAAVHTEVRLTPNSVYSTVTHCIFFLSLFHIYLFLSFSSTQLFFTFLPITHP